jgi:hypothetical protein
MRSFLFLIFIAVAAFLSTLGTSGCANIIPPSGGPTDSLPPVLVSASIPDSTLNFRGDRITFTFDEFVDLREVQNNLMFTPIFETNPRVEVRLKTVTVRFTDSLESNTTYNLNFGDAIVDYNEGNPLQGFNYTFSTGPSLDSLTLSGKVVLAETGGIDTTLTVLLHRNLSDSAVRKQAPRYVTKLDRAGNFSFKNLPADTFAVFVLGNATNTLRRYQDTTQLFGFADSFLITRPGQRPEVTLLAYRSSPVAAAQLPGAPPVNTRDNRLRFTTSTQSAPQDLMSDLTLTFQTPLRRFDSSRISLTTDSTFLPTPYTVSLDSTRRELRFRTAWKEGTRYNLIVAQDFATDTLNRQLLKGDTLNFTTRKATDYGSISLRIRGLDAARNPVLQFIQNDRVVFSVPVSSGTFTQRLFTPGEYDLRILYDRNGNGKWDPGQFFGTRRQPEIVVPIQQKITVKPAWENDFERSL